MSILLNSNLTNFKNMFLIKTHVVTGTGKYNIALPAVSGYKIIAAANGDWNANNVQPNGVAMQGNTPIVLFPSAISGGIRINALYIKMSY